MEGATLSIGRELIGYFPWRLDVGQNSTNAKGREAAYIQSTSSAITEYGATTLEQTNQYFITLKDSTYCCDWQGRSRSFSTSVYLGTLLKLALGIATRVRRKASTPDISQRRFTISAETNYKDGILYTVESHLPRNEYVEWRRDKSRLAFSSPRQRLTKVLWHNAEGTLEHRLEMRPLLPSNWPYFATENLSYHGTLLSINWD